MSIEDMPSRKKSVRLWTNLPLEMLAEIAIRLALIDLLSFRGTCRYWRASSSTATAENKSCPKHKAWFLLYEQGSTYKQSTILLNPIASKKYNIDIPELRGAHCLTSHQGWLLLHYDCGSLLCFSPFSRAKINLPSFPNSEISDPMAAISAPPTSEKCVICVINRRDDGTMDLHVSHRGDVNWTKIDCKFTIHLLDNVTGTAFDKGTFYFFDGTKKLWTYSLTNKDWISYKLVKPEAKSAPRLPFSFVTSYFKESGMGNLAELEDGMSISTCGTVVQNFSGSESDDGPIIIQNETVVNGSGETEKVVTTKVYGFNLYFVKSVPTRSGLFDKFTFESRYIFGY